MVTKGIIKGRSNTTTAFKYDVEIYIFKAPGDKAGPGVIQAIAAYTPSSFAGYKTGDCVIVSFENNEFDNPVILGKLLKPTDQFFDAEAEINNLKEEVARLKTLLTGLNLYGGNN